MLRRALLFLLAIVVTTSACSDDSTSIDSVVLTTNSETYQLVPGVPPPPVIVTLHNNRAESVSVLMCETTYEAQIIWQQRAATHWVDIPYGRTECDGIEAPLIIGPNSTWTVSPADRGPPPTAGQYRVRVEWSPWPLTTVESAVSNDIYVVGGLEPAVTHR
jgi:hypothetical protein